MGWDAGGIGAGGGSSGLTQPGFVVKLRPIAAVRFALAYARGRPQAAAQALQRDGSGECVQASLPDAQFKPRDGNTTHSAWPGSPAPVKGTGFIENGISCARAVAERVTSQANAVRTASACRTERVAVRLSSSADYVETWQTNTLRCIACRASEQ